MRTIALVVGLALVLGCSSDKSLPDWPDVETLYSFDGEEAPTCTSAVAEEGLPAGGPFTTYECWWERVIVDGRPSCWAHVAFARESAETAWTFASITSSAATCW